MKKLLLIFVGLVYAAAFGGADAAVTIKKAAPVATKQAAPMDVTGSLLPTVLGLVSSVQQLSAQQKKLTADCIPTTQELTFVNNTVKEWAKTGAMSVEEVKTALKRQPCQSATGGYRVAVEVGGATEGNAICFDHYAGAGNEGMIWFGYPIASKATYCVDGSLSCSDKNKETVSDIYDIFNLIDFSTADYTPQEATMAGKLMAKIENCSHSKLSAKKRAIWGEFLTNTISGVGQSTNTGTIMETVSSITSSGGGVSSLGSLGQVAAQFLQ